jgi:hypothetical protein
MESSLIYLLPRRTLSLYQRLATRQHKKQAEKNQPLQYDAAPIVMTIAAQFSMQNCLSRVFCRIMSS